MKHQGVISFRNGKPVANETLEDFKPPKDPVELTKARIASVTGESSEMFKAVCYASLMGEKFMPAIIKLVLNAEENQFNKTMQKLVVSGIFNTFNNYNFIFKRIKRRTDSTNGKGIKKSQSSNARDVERDVEYAGIS